MNFSCFAFLLPNIADTATHVSNTIFHFCNSIVGHSRVVDELIALPLDNQLVKAAVIGACFLAAWFGSKDDAVTLQRRKILLLTLIASVFVIATTKTLSKTVFLPRPFIQSQKAFHLEGDTLVASEKLPYRVPLDSEDQKSFKNLLAGNVVQNDLGSFPSDHAGFYVTLAFGIFLAARGLGLLALFWAWVVIIGSRVVTGQHSPLDVVVGAGIGIVILLVVQIVARRGFRWLLDPITNWTMRHPVLSSALLFTVLFEATSTLQNIRPLLKTGVAIGKHLIGG